MKGFRKSTAAIGIALLAILVLPGQVQAADPAGVQGAQAPEAVKALPMSGCPCNCEGCCADCCGKDCLCGHKHHGHGIPPMMGGMKMHMEEVRKSVTALREHEKKMEGITDPAEFRKAAVAHFRMLDDLQESHVKHMESMMGRGGQGPMRRGHGHDQPCKDCPGK
jgi:hypothetical protein